MSSRNNNHPDPPPTASSKLSSQNFKQGAHILIELFQRIERSSSRRNDVIVIGFDDVVLHHWELKCDSSSIYSDCYLSHPPLMQRIYCENLQSLGTSITCDEHDLDDTEEEEDSTLLIHDPAVAQVETTPIDSIPYDDIEWMFSIVYSHVWSVPVLYFQLQYADGVLLTRKQVMHILNKYNGNTENVVQDNDGDNNDIAVDGEADGWNFVSQEEHPITGVPTFFFHPCQTSNRMNLVYKNYGNVVNINPGQWILTWISMILPAAGFRLSPKIFQELHTILEERSR